MTHFEYVSIAAAFIFALVITRLLAALPHILDPSRRYWIHTVWAAQVFLMTIASFWNIWSFRTETWSSLGFLGLLSFPTLLFVRAVVLIPDDPDRVQSWEEFFFDRRVSFFAVTAFAPINSLVTGYLLTEHYEVLPWHHGGILLGAVAALIGCFSDNRIVHAILAVSSLLVGLLWFAAR